MFSEETAGAILMLMKAGKATRKLAQYDEMYRPITNQLQTHLQNVLVSALKFDDNRTKNTEKLIHKLLSKKIK